MKMKRIKLIALLTTISLLFAGCSNATTTDNTDATSNVAQELTQNDYRGGLFRLRDTKSIVISAIDELLAKNKEVQTENPSSYWESEDFQYFRSNFVSEKALKYSDFLNEYQSTWEDAVAYTIPLLVEDGCYEDEIEVIRNDENDYTIKAYLDNKERQMDFYYDANHSWLRAKSSYESFYNSELVTDSFLEYARINEYVSIYQTETERLVVFLKDAYTEVADEEGNVTQVKDGYDIDKFYYSKLSGNMRDIYANKYLYDEDGEIILTLFGNPEIINYEELGIDTGAYSLKNVEDYSAIDPRAHTDDKIATNESLFVKGTDVILEDVNAWVHENNKDYSHYIVYENGGMIAYIYNPLAEKIEMFTFNADGTCSSEFIELEINETEDTIIDGEEIPKDERVYVKWNETLSVYIGTDGNVYTKNEEKTTEDMEIVTDENGKDYLIFTEETEEEPKTYIVLFMEKEENGEDN